MSDIDNVIEKLQLALDFYKADPPSNLDSYVGGLHSGRIQGLQIAINELKHYDSAPKIMQLKDVLFVSY